MTCRGRASNRRRSAPSCRSRRVMPQDARAWHKAVRLRPSATQPSSLAAALTPRPGQHPRPPKHTKAARTSSVNSTAAHNVFVGGSQHRLRQVDRRMFPALPVVSRTEHSKPIW
ncbi:uncharacterized protein LOC122248726 [Penaeus japonicus]|uniref:uncharacterized protein LOC122248726 n=1 Tax=Penaeus japonicus TaxID=27405 RepID=UPI001C70DDDD|nr:uncharacterized protein LOC122248726 [Penaeus japonicus]